MLEHFLQLNRDPLLADLSLELALDLLIFKRIDQTLLQSELVSRGEPDRSQDSQWIIQESLLRRQRRPDNSIFQIIQTCLGPVFDLLSFDIVKKRVDRQISSVGVLLSGSDCLKVK